jgi:hypothetical protein
MRSSARCDPPGPAGVAVFNQPDGNTQTNDLGQFRIYGLSPGDYYVSATFRGADIMAMEISVSALAGGVASGGPTGSFPNSGCARPISPEHRIAPRRRRLRSAWVRKPRTRLCSASGETREDHRDRDQL